MSKTINRYSPYPIRAQFYIRDAETLQLLVRPASDGGFVRFEHEADAEKYAQGLNRGVGWPERFDWGGGPVPR